MENKLEEARKLYETANADQKYVLESLFPELRGSEDERIKREIKVILANADFSRFKLEYTFYDMIDWLERQGEKKSAKAKFNVGDWVIDSQGIVRQIEKVVENVTNHTFGYDLVGGDYFNEDYDVRLWTIEDAKPGDVLYYKDENGIEYIVMNKGLNEHNNIDSYFMYDSIDGFGIDIPAVLDSEFDGITPATKEQCDTLMKEMVDAGYKWDDGKKKLVKIDKINS